MQAQVGPPGQARANGGTKRRKAKAGRTAAAPSLFDCTPPAVPRAKRRAVRAF